MKLWDAATGALLRTFDAGDPIRSVAFSPDGTRALSGSGTTVKIWKIKTGELLASMIGERDGEWLTMTPKGFFVSSTNGPQALNLVRGLKVFALQQYSKELRKPELVENVLKGDRTASYRNASSALRTFSTCDHRRKSGADGASQLGAKRVEGESRWRLNRITSKRTLSRTRPSLQMDAAGAGPWLAAR